jgi:hypothetical protein
MNRGRMEEQLVEKSGWKGWWRRVAGKVGGEEWLEKVYNRQEWKKLFRTARNRLILHMHFLLDPYINRPKPPVTSKGYHTAVTNICMN